METKPVISANILFQGRGVVVIEEGKIETALNDKMTIEEHALVACIATLLTKIQNGQFVQYDFDIKDFQKLDELVKCEWLPRTGNLKFHGPTKKRFRFVDDIDEALKEKRTFTCQRGVFNQLPANKNDAK